MALASKVNSPDRLGSIDCRPAVTVLDPVDIQPIVKQALKDEAVKLQSVAALPSFECHPSHVTRLLNGEPGKHLTVDQIEALPIEVQRRFAKTYAEAHGFTVTEPSIEAKAVGDLLSALGSAIRAFSGLPSPRPIRMEPTK